MFGGLGQPQQFGRMGARVGRSPGLIVAPGFIDRSRLTFSRAQPAGSISTALGPDGVTLEQFAADVPRFQAPARGLLMEGQRSNLLLNTAVLSTQSVTVAAAAHTLSFYGTGTVTLSGASTAGPLVGTGATQRVSLTFTPAAGTLTLTVTGSVTSAQLEPGAFASSYVPTTGAAATRGVDILTATAGQFTSLFPAGVGTVLVSAVLANMGAGSAGRTVFSLDDGTVNNRVTLRNTAGSTNVTPVSVIAGAATNFGAAAVTDGAPFRAGLTFAPGALAYSLNGAAAATLAQLPPGLANMTVGAREGVGDPLFGEVRHFRTLPFALSAADLPAAVAAIPQV